jgi:hypothetical protein
MAALQGDDLEEYLRLAAACGTKNGKIEHLLSQVGAVFGAVVQCSYGRRMWVLGAGWNVSQW